MSEPRPKAILHIDLDSFFVSVERVLDPSLEGKPVLVSGNPEGRGVVSSASYEAREFGVRSAMPIGRAKKLCPQCVILPVRMKAYADFSEKVFELLREFSPLVEEASIDEAYVDVTGTEKLFGPPRRLAEKMQKAVKQRLGLPSSIGIGRNKLVAKIASKLAKPAGIVEVAPGREREFLAGLSIRVIPGVGGKTEERLNEMGVAKVRDLVRLGPEKLSQSLGKWGAELWRHGQGMGDDVVVSEEPAPKSLGKEVTFDEDLSDPEQIGTWLYFLAHQLGLRLRKRGLYARHLTVKLRSPEFKTWTRGATLEPATSHDFDLYSAAKKILDKEKGKGLTLRLLGICAGSLTESRQLSLFEREEIEKRDRLFKALDRLREKFGVDTVYPAGL